MYVNVNEGRSGSQKMCTTMRATPRAGMYSPFRAGKGREIVERAGGGGYGFCDHGVDAKEWLKGEYCFSIPGKRR